MLEFLLGFLAFPVVIGLALYLFARATEPPEVDIRFDEAAQRMLRALLDRDRAGSTLFISWPDIDLRIRVSNRVRKSKPNTLAIEIRNVDGNREFYPAIKSSFASAGIEFEERRTPARRLPKHLRVVWPDGGPLVVSAVCQVLSVLESSIPKGTSQPRTGSLLDPVVRRARRADAV